MNDEKLMTVKQVAEMLKVSRVFVQKEIVSGNLKAYRFGKKGMYRIPEEQLQEYLKKSKFEK